MLICRKTMQLCQQPGMCMPFGGCQPQAMPATPSETTSELRDWFAGKALEGMISREGLEGNDIALIAHKVYEMADAMIAERNKQP